MSRDRESGPGSRAAGLKRRRTSWRRKESTTILSARLCVPRRGADTLKGPLRRPMPRKWIRQPIPWPSWHLGRQRWCPKGRPDQVDTCRLFVSIPCRFRNGGSDKHLAKRRKREVDETVGSYRVTIEGPGVRIEREVADDVGRQLVMAVMASSESADTIATAGTQPTVPTSMAAPPIPMEGAEPDLSLREFMDTVLPKRNPDKLTAIAVFLKRPPCDANFQARRLGEGFRERR